MKNFISFLTFFILANNVYAANWSFLGETDEYRFELDLDSIKKIKRSEFGSYNTVTQFWVKKTIINDLTKDGLSVGDHLLDLYHIDCNEDTLGVKSIVKYKNNKVVDSYTESTVKMYPIVPDTVGSSYLKSVCTQ